MSNDDRTILKSFLASYLQGPPLADDEDIFASGVVNSLFAMQLVLFVEREFGIAVENDDLELDNFRTIEALVRFIARKRSGASAAPTAEPATA